MKYILPVSPRRPGLLNDAAITSSIERYEVERIVSPTLVITMADDLFGTFDAGRYTAEQIPHARSIVYPTGGHMGVGHQQQMMSEIASFIRAAQSPRDRSLFSTQLVKAIQSALPKP
jgi:2-hydroxy-6-oxonona-2,4-dienedioate hydrolase